MYLGKTITSSAALFAMLMVLLLPTSMAVVSAESPIVGLDLIVLVDESGSLKEAGIRSEISALTSLLGRKDLVSTDDFQVRVSVVGFGSGSKAADVKCPLVELTDESSVALLKCANKIKLRTSKESWNTDFAAAFSAALKQFRRASDSESQRAVILMTDGKYDPSGKREAMGLTQSEIGSLNASLAALSEAKTQVWPLGFGEVIPAELENLAVDGASANCPAGAPTPRATVASTANLETYLLDILSATLCKKFLPPTTIPDKFSVHPLVTKVSLSVRGALLNPVVTDGSGSGTDVCATNWAKSKDGSITCQIEIGGNQSGKWEVQTTEKTPTKPTVEKTFVGEGKLLLTNCDSGSPEVELARADGSAISWTSLEGTTWAWPAVNVKVGGKEKLIRIDKASVPTSFTQLDPKQMVIVELAPDQPEFIWLRAAVDSCEIAAPLVPGTTVAVPGTTVAVGGGVDGENGGGKGIWLFILGAIAIGAATFLLLRRVKGRKFPFGTEVHQFKQEGWSSRGDISGVKEIGLSVDGNGWIHIGGGEESLMILKASHKPDLGDFVVITKAVNDDEKGSQENYFAYGTDAVVDGIRIKVEAPVESEDEYD